IVTLYREARNEDRQRWTFTVPRKRNRAPIDAKRRVSGGNIDPFHGRGDSFGSRSIPGWPSLHGNWQPMKHVQQRLLMHFFVFDNSERGFGGVQQRVPRLIEISVRQRVDHASIGLFGKCTDVASGWPLRA